MFVGNATGASSIPVPYWQ